MASRELNKLIQPLIEALGFEFVGLEHGPNPKHSVLVIYIDKAEGIDVEDCATVSREVSALLDVEDPISGRYTLEVSSPGLDRPLFTLQQYAQFAGQEAKISLFAPAGGRRRFKGVILSAENDVVAIEQDGERFVLDLGNIAKGRLVPDYDQLFERGAATPNGRQAID